MFRRTLLAALALVCDSTPECQGDMSDVAADLGFLDGETALMVYSETPNQHHLTCLQIGPNGQPIFQVTSEFHRAAIGIRTDSIHGVYPYENQSSWGQINFEVREVNGNGIQEDSTEVTVDRDPFCQFDSQHRFFDGEVKINNNICPSATYDAYMFRNEASRQAATDDLHTTMEIGVQGNCTLYVVFTVRPKVTGGIDMVFDVRVHGAFGPNQGPEWEDMLNSRMMVNETEDHVSISYPEKLLRESVGLPPEPNPLLNTEVLRWSTVFVCGATGERVKASFFALDGNSFRAVIPEDFAPVSCGVMYWDPVLTPLAVFEAILHEVVTVAIATGDLAVQAALCANVAILSRESFQNMFTSDWCSTPPAVLVWLLILSSLALIVWAMRRDRQDTAWEMGYEDVYFVEGTKPDVGFSVADFAHNALLNSSGVWSAMSEKWDCDGRDLANKSVRERILLAVQESHEEFSDDDATALVADSFDEDYKNYFEMTFFDRFRLLVVELNPWLSLQNQSVSMTTTHRSLFLTLNVFGAMMIAALFFEATGGALSSRSPEECETSGFWDKLGRDIGIAIFTALISSIPHALLQMAVTKNIQYADKWDDAAMQHVLSSWYVLDVFVTIVGATYLVFSLVLILSFIANVLPADAYHWFLSALWILFQKIAFQSVLMSVFGSVVASVWADREI